MNDSAGLQSLVGVPYHVKATPTQYAFYCACADFPRLLRAKPRLIGIIIIIASQQKASKWRI